MTKKINPVNEVKQMLSSSGWDWQMHEGYGVTTVTFPRFSATIQIMGNSGAMEIDNIIHKLNKNEVRAILGLLRRS